MNDFENGFSIILKPQKTKGRLPIYEINEQKTANTCPYCYSSDIRKENKKYHSRWVYAVIEDQFSYCRLNRWQYYCKECDEYFYNTEEINAYGKRHHFTRNFIDKALQCWLDINDSDPKTAPSLSQVARNIGIPQKTISEWNSLMGESLSPILPDICHPIIVGSFLDGDRNRRGFICQVEGTSLKLLDFVDEYTKEWIGNYLVRITENSKSAFFSDVSEVYFDYAPGLGNILHEYFYKANIGLNLNNLYQQICKCLYSLTEEEAIDFRTELRKEMFPVDKNDDYLSMWIPQAIRSKIRQLPAAEQSKFTDIINSMNDRYIDATRTLKLAKISTDSLRKRIKKLVANHHTYATIKVKILYDNPDYREDIRNAMKKASEVYGRKFDFMTWIK